MPLESVLVCQWILSSTNNHISELSRHLTLCRNCFFLRLHPAQEFQGHWLFLTISQGFCLCSCLCLALHLLLLFHCILILLAAMVLLLLVPIVLCLVPIILCLVPIILRLLPIILRLVPIVRVLWPQSCFLCPLCCVWWPLSCVLQLLSCFLFPLSCVLWPLSCFFLLLFLCLYCVASLVLGHVLPIFLHCLVSTISQSLPQIGTIRCHVLLNKMCHPWLSCVLYLHNPFSIAPDLSLTMQAHSQIVVGGSLAQATQ